MTPRPPTAGLFSRQVRAQALAYFFMVGAAVGATGLLFPHDEGLREVPILGLAALAAAIGLAARLRAGTISEAALHIALAAGTLIVSATNYFVGTTSLFPILYTWTALYAFACFALRPALLHWSLAAGCYLTLLAIQSPQSPVTRWLLAMGTPLLTGVLISWLLDRLGREAQRTAERTRVLGDSEQRDRRGGARLVHDGRGGRHRSVVESGGREDVPARGRCSTRPAGRRARLR